MKKLVLIAALFLAVSVIPTAMADTFQLQYDTVFSGTTPPEGISPWLLATFTDTGANTVDLNVSWTGLPTGEFLGALYFNNTLASIPSFSLTPTGVQTVAGTNSGLNAYKADGDGKYDIRINFPEPAAQKFTDDKIFTATLTGTGLTAASFNSLSVDGGEGAGHYLTAAHIQGIPDGSGDTTSAWVAGNIAVPEPVSTTLFLLGGATLAVRKLRRKA